MKNIFLWKRKMYAMFGLLDYWFKVRIHCFRIQDSGFRKRAVNHSLITRKFILCYIRSNKNHNSKGTPPCTFKRLEVSVCSSRVHLYSALVYCSHRVQWYRCYYPHTFYKLISPFKNLFAEPNQTTTVQNNCFLQVSWVYSMFNYYSLGDIA